MKRMFAYLLSTALLLGLLGGCRNPQPSGPSSEPKTDWTAANLSEIAFQFSGFDESNEFEHLYITHDREGLAAYIENAYGLEGWEDAAVSRATGASAFEVAVLRLEDEDGAVRAAIALHNYMTARQGDFAGYAPAEVDMIANGDLRQIGPWLGLFICPDPAGAARAFEAALYGEPLTIQTGGAAEPKGVKELRDALVSHCGMDEADLELLDDGDLDALSAYMEEAYGLAPDAWEECAIARDTGDSAFEIAVLTVADWDDAGQSARERQREIEEKLNDYLDAQEAASEERYGMLYQALTITAEQYVVLLACEDAKQATRVFQEAAGTNGFAWSSRHRFPAADPGYPGRCKFFPPNRDDMSLYDTSAIRAAWEKGDPSGLSSYDRDIYDAAQRVLDEVLEDGMSGYEKEKAVYSWIVNNVDYDWSHQNIRLPTPRESFTPYGGLVNHKAVCLGYATSFQLLCDLAGVECITVVGAAHTSMSDHGWNMVRLNGEWYCLDVTWDANYRETGSTRGREDQWDYFNVTSDYMADTDHQWDYANTPEAVTEGGGRD